MDSVGEGESGEIWENGIETCIVSYFKKRKKKCKKHKQMEIKQHDSK